MTDAARQYHGFTWDDYREWDDCRRWEVIGGDAFDMSPAPLVRHQAVVCELTVQLHAYFKGKPCRVWPSPTDVKLSAQDVVQPDLSVVCDKRQIRRTHIEGPPSLVVEVVSEATLMHDRVRKFNLYARAGVKEYWIVTPYPHLVEVFGLRRGGYALAGGYGKDDVLRSPSFPDLKLDLTRVFDFPIGDAEKVDAVKEGRPTYRVRSTRRRTRDRISKT